MSLEAAQSLNLAGRCAHLGLGLVSLVKILESITVTDHFNKILLNIGLGKQYDKCNEGEREIQKLNEDNSEILDLMGIRCVLRPSSAPAKVESVADFYPRFVVTAYADYLDRCDTRDIPEGERMDFENWYRSDKSQSVVEMEYRKKILEHLESTRLRYTPPDTIEWQSVCWDLVDSEKLLAFFHQRQDISEEYQDIFDAILQWLLGSVATKMQYWYTHTSEGQKELQNQFELIHALKKLDANLGFGILTTLALTSDQG